MDPRFLALSLILVLACGAERSEEGATVDPLPGISRPDRSIAVGGWDTVYTVGGSVNDTLLLMPRTLSGGGNRVVAYDYGDDRVKSFSADGKLEWMVGGTGGGPGEFRGNFGLQVDSQNYVWAIDPDLARVTVLDRNGQVRAIYPLAIERLAGMAVVSGRLVAVSSNPTTALHLVEDGGAVSERVPPPLSALKSLPEFARSVIAASNGGAVWALAYPYGNLLAVYEDLELRCTGKLVTGQEFPTQPVRDPIFSVSAIALQDSMVVLLGNGGGEERNRHLDRYALTDCRYLDSMELPDRFSAMAYDGQQFVLERHDPAPALIALRWSPQ